MMRKLREQLSCIECTSGFGEDVYGRGSKGRSSRSSSFRSGRSNRSSSIRSSSSSSYHQGSRKYASSQHSQRSMNSFSHPSQSFDVSYMSGSHHNSSGYWSKENAPFCHQAHGPRNPHRITTQNHHNMHRGSSKMPVDLTNGTQGVRKQLSVHQDRNISTHPRRNQTSNYSSSFVSVDGHHGKVTTDDNKNSEILNSDNKFEEGTKNILRENPGRRVRSISFAGVDDFEKATKKEIRPRSTSFSVLNKYKIEPGSLSGDGLAHSLVSIVHNEWHSHTHIASDGEDHHKHMKSILKNGYMRLRSLSTADCTSDSFQERRARVNSVTFADIEDKPILKKQHSVPDCMLNNKSGSSHSQEQGYHDMSSVKPKLDNNSHDSTQPTISSNLDSKPPLPNHDRHLEHSAKQNTLNNQIPTGRSKINRINMSKSTSSQSSSRPQRTGMHRTHSFESDTHSSTISNDSVLGIPKHAHVHFADPDSRRNSIHEWMSKSNQPQCVDESPLENEVQDNITAPLTAMLETRESPVPDVVKGSSTSKKLRRPNSSSMLFQKVDGDSTDTMCSDPPQSLPNPRERRRRFANAKQRKDYVGAKHSAGSSSTTDPPSSPRSLHSNTSSDNISSIYSDPTNKGYITKHIPSQTIEVPTEVVEVATAKARTDDLDTTLKGDDMMNSELISDTDTTTIQAESISMSSFHQNSNTMLSDTQSGKDVMVHSIDNNNIIPESKKRSKKKRNKSLDQTQSSVCSIPNGNDNQTNSTSTSVNDSFHKKDKRSFSRKTSSDGGRIETRSGNPEACVEEQSTSCKSKETNHFKRRKSMDEILNDSTSMLYNNHSLTRLYTTEDSTIDGYIEDSYIENQHDSLPPQPSRDSSVGQIPMNNSFLPPPPEELLRLNHSVEWTLGPEEIPESSTDSESDMNGEVMSNNMIEDDDDIKSFIDQNDLSQVLVSRGRITTGRIMMRDESSIFTMCSGSFAVPDTKRRMVHRPITVQIYKNLNDKEDRINVLKNVIAILNLRHVHIQVVYGICTEGFSHTSDGGELLVLLERTHYLVTLNKLLTWASENNPQLLTPRCAIVIAAQLCDALWFLEKKSILHANLSSHTVRLDQQCNVKIGGIEQFHVSSTAAPIRWMALETLDRGEILPKSAVWTFGVILWEIISVAGRPYHNLKTGQILQQLKQGYRLPKPQKCSHSLYDFLLRCWLPDPEDRPMIPALKQDLESYLQLLPPSKSPAELFPDREDFWDIS